MNKINLPIRGAGLWLILMSLFSCSESSEPKAAKPPPLVQMFEVGSPDHSMVRRFVGRVDALSTVDMAFQVSGRIDRLVEKQGVVIPKGDLLAGLETQDYALALRQSEASFRQAESDYSRGQQLQKNNYISQSEFDGLQTTFDNAELAVENARLNLEYTELHAPFDALITNRLVEKFSYIQPNEAVLRVQNISYLRVHVNVPEQLMRYAVENSSAYQLFVEKENGELVSGKDGVPLSLEYLEHKTEINPTTQTYQVTFKLPREESMDLLPGMVVTVKAVIANSVRQNGLWVPVTALDSSGDAEFGVWKIENDQVTYHAVSVTEIQGERAMVGKGLEPNTKIVAAGVESLQNNMKIREFVPGGQKR